MWEWVRIVGRGVASALKSRGDLALENIALWHWGTAVSSGLGLGPRHLPEPLRVSRGLLYTPESASVARRYLSRPPVGIRDIRSGRAGRP